MLHEQGEITQIVACNLLHEKDGIKQTMCLNARSFFFGIFIIHTPNLTERYFMHQDARYENPKRD